MLIMSKQLLRNAFADKNSKRIMNQVFKTKPEKQLEYLKARGKNLKTNVNWNEMDSKAHSQAFTVANIHSADILNMIYEKLLKANEEGLTVKEFLKDTENIRELTGLTESRLKFVYETNLNIAYAKGQFEHQQRLGEAGLRPFIKYLASRAEKKDDLHKEFYNLVLPFNDPFWNDFYPPSRFGCKCSTRSISQKEVDSKKIEVKNGNTLIKSLEKDNRYKSQIAETRENGIKLNQTFKPNLEKYFELTREELNNKFSKMIFSEMPEKEYESRYTEYYKVLSEEVKESLRGYKGKGFEEINNYLRGSSTKRNEGIRKSIDRMIDEDLNYELEQSTLVYRGMRFTYSNKDIFDYQLEMLRSKMYSDNAFISTSTSEKISNSYARTLKDDVDSIFITIKLPKGSKVGYGQFKESEIILKPNSNFFVTGLYEEVKKGSDKKIIYASMVYLP